MNTTVLPQFDATKPGGPTLPLEPLPPQTSSITLPISIPISRISEELEDIASRHWEIPAKTFSTDFAGLGAQFKVYGYVTTSNVVVSGTGRKLRVSVKYGGAIKIRVRGKGWLGYTSWSSAATLGIEGKASASTRIAIDKDWRFKTQNLAVDVDISDVDVGFEDFGLANTWNNYIEAYAERELKRELKELIEGADFLKPEASKWWRRLCTNLPIAYPGILPQSDLFLEFRPLKARVIHPRITEKAVKIQLGLDFSTRVLAHSTEPDCPLPKRLVVERPAPSSVSVRLPIDVKYLTVDDILDTKEVVNVINAKLSKAIDDSEIGKYFSGVIESIKMEPYGQRLLVAVNIEIKGNSLIERPVTVTIYLAARPRLDAEQRQIQFTDIAVDSASKNELVAELADEFVEPWLREFLSTFEGTPIDLSRMYEEVVAQGNAILEDIGDLGKLDEFVDIRIMLKEVDVAEIGIGSEYLRFVVQLGGDVAVAVE